MTKAQRITLAYIIALGSMGYIATEIYLPSLPAIESFFDTKESLVQLTLFSYLVSFSLAPIFVGPLADKVGRKPVILIGLTLGILASLACTYAPSIYMLIAARFVHGLAMGSVVVGSRSMIPDTFGGKDLNKVSSYLAMSIPIFVALSPAIGGFIEHHTIWRFVFGALTIYTMLLLILCKPLKETHTQLNTKPYLTILSQYRALFGNPGFFRYLILIIVPMIGFMGFLTAGPFLFQELVGLNPAEFGLLSLVNAAMVISGGFINSRLINWLEPEQILGFATGVMMISGIGSLAGLYWGWPIFWVLLIPSALNVLAIPIIYANASHRAFGFITEHFGMASALFASFQFLGALIGSLIFSILEERSGIPLGICYLSCSIVMLVLLLSASAYHRKTCLS